MPKNAKVHELVIQMLLDLDQPLTCKEITERLCSKDPKNPYAYDFRIKSLKSDPYSIVNNSIRRRCTNIRINVGYKHKYFVALINQHGQTVYLLSSQLNAELPQKDSTADIISLKQKAISRSRSGPLYFLSSEREYVRDPYISQYAKKVACGVCQLCHNPAPFKDANNEPYLESHHIQWLSKGGSDSVDNVIALCPNCHRKMHIINSLEDVAFLKDIASNN